MIVKRLHSTCALGLAALCLACNGNAPNPIAVRDSSGITIVESERPVWTTQDAWQVDNDPVLTIGGLENGAEIQFDGVRKALRLEDRMVLVADRGSSGLHYFDSTGAYIRSVGGRGEGPGEYRLLAQVHRLGKDSLVVWDMSLHRGTVLSTNGRHGRNVRRPTVGDESYMYVAGAFGDGSLLGVFSEGVAPGKPAKEVQQNYDILFRYTGDRVDTIGTFFSIESYVAMADGTSSYSIPFGPRGVFVADDSVLHFTSGRLYEVRTYDLEGKLIRIARVRRDLTPITEQMRKSYIEMTLSNISDGTRRADRQRVLSEMPFPRFGPSFSALAIDIEGNLWAASYAGPGEEKRKWSIFDRSGQFLGDLELPSNLEVHEIGRDFVLGREKGELDVERVVMYRIVK